MKSILVFSVFLCFANLQLLFALSDDKVFLPDVDPYRKSKYEIDAEKENAAKWEARRQKIVNMTLEAWNVYVEHSWGRRYHTISKGDNVRYVGDRHTLIDSLSTLLVMNLTEEYQRAEEWISKEMEMEKLFDVPLLSAFLSAYALTGRELYLRKSQELVRLVKLNGKQ